MEVVVAVVDDDVGSQHIVAYWHPSSSTYSNKREKIGYFDFFRFEIDRNVKEPKIDISI